MVIQIFAGDYSLVKLEFITKTISNLPLNSNNNTKVLEVLSNNESLEGSDSNSNEGEKTNPITNY